MRYFRVRVLFSAERRQWFVPVAWNVFTQKKRNKHSTHVREQKYKEVGVQTPKRRIKRQELTEKQGR